MARRRLAHILTSLAILAGVGAATVGGAERAEAAVPCVDQNFSQGSRGTCVTRIQILANFWDHGQYPNLYVDGYYGPVTKKKIAWLQSRHQGVVSDGWVGRQTWRYVLCSLQQDTSDNRAVVPWNFPIKTWTAAGCKAEFYPTTTIVVASPPKAR
ncbi:MAG: peptidoglycan-binding domain-containing protein [Propioniciclava sp.]